jgi:hypothetical protein
MKTVRILITALVLQMSFMQGAFALPHDGQALYEKKCSRCHQAYSPEEFSARQWPGILKSMKDEAGLSDGEMAMLSEYLIRESAPLSEESELSGPQLGGYLYTEYFQTPEKTKNYDLHYLALHVSGWAAENIEYLGEFEFEHGGKGDNAFIEQAYLDYWFLPNVAIKIGAMLTPFNRFDEMHDPLGNQLITRPQMSREIGVSAWKDVGADLHGYFNVGREVSVSFDLYSINGLGDGTNLRSSRQYRDNNEDKAFGGRVSVTLRDGLELGVSTYSGAWDEGSKHDLVLFGAHGRLKTHIADFLAEYAQATSENPAPAEDGEMSGYFIQVSRLIHSKFRPVVRIGALDYLDEGTELGRDPTKGNGDLSELAFGFTYYPVSSVALKVEYTFFNEGDRVAQRDNDQLGVQAAVRF